MRLIHILGLCSSALAMTPWIPSPSAQQTPDADHIAVISGITYDLTTPEGTMSLIGYTTLTTTQTISSGTMTRVTTFETSSPKYSYVLTGEWSTWTGWPTTLGPAVPTEVSAATYKPAATESTTASISTAAVPAGAAPTGRWVIGGAALAAGAGFAMAL